MKKRNYLILLLFVIGSTLCMFNHTMETLAATDYSDELIHEPFISLDSIENHYDGVETFYHDTLAAYPIYWYCQTPSEIGTVVDYEDHQKVLKKVDSGYASKYYFNDVVYTKPIGISYWMNVEYESGGANYGSIELYFNNSKILGTRVYHLNTANRDEYGYRLNLGSWVVYKQITPITTDWFRVNIEIYEDSGNIVADIYWNGVFQLQVILFTVPVEGFELDHIEVFSIDAFDHDQFTYIDAINLYHLDGSAISNKTQIINGQSIYYEGYKTQITNTIPIDITNIASFTSDDYFSMRDSLISRYPTFDNNYRTELMEDDVITDSYIDPTRILRMEGTDTTQNKYKVEQFYFTGLNETYAEYSQTYLNNSYFNSSYTDYSIINGTLYSEGDLGYFDNNNFTVNSTKTQISPGHFKGTYTFRDIEAGNLPDNWYDLSGSGCSASVIDSVGNHEKVLDLYDGSTNTFRADLYLEDAGLDMDVITAGTVEFYFRSTSSSSTKATYFNIRNHDYSKGFGICFRHDFRYYYDGGTGYFDGGVAIDTWYKFRMDYDFSTGMWDLWMNDTKYSGSGWTMYDTTVDYDYLIISSYTAGSGHHTYIDSLSFTLDGIYEIDDLLEIEPLGTSELNFSLSQKIDMDNTYNFSIHTLAKVNISTQLMNISIYNFSSNTWVNITQGYFSTTNFNESTYQIGYINDFVNETNYLLIAFYGLNETSNWTFYLDCFNISYYKIELMDINNQSLQIRVDTFNPSNLLINILYWNIQFNNSAGKITWQILYRESATIPRWHLEPTNPIFNFDEYLDEGEVLTSLQINAHFYLTEHTNQKWLYIRTQVCFNDNYDAIYEYDKIIDLGDSTFYDTQSRIGVRYIDYFNDNYITPYTHSNLRGYRTLMLNTTQMKYNFLECGFYNTKLNFYLPPPEPDDIDDTPSDEDFTLDINWFGGNEYWYFDIYWFEEKPTTTDLDAGDLHLDYQEYQLITISGNKFYYYNLKGNVWGDWGIFNFIRDAIYWIINLFLNLFQLLLYGITWLILFLVMFLIVDCFAILLFWNVLFLFGLWGIMWIIWGVWLLLIIIYEDALIPAAQWFFESGLEAIIDIIILLMAFIITLGIYFISGGQIVWNDVFDSVQTVLEYVFDEIMNWVEVFVVYLPYLVSMIVIWLTWIVLAWLLWKIFDARGWHKNGEQYEKLFLTLIAPIRILLNIWARIKGGGGR